MRVDDLRTRTANGARDTRREQRIDVTRSRHALERNRQLLVERIRRPCTIVEPEEAHVHAALGESGQQRQEMPFGSADPADPMNVKDLQAATSAGASTCS